ESEGNSPIRGDGPASCNWQSNGCCHNHFDGVSTLEMPFNTVWQQYLDARQCGINLDLPAHAYAFSAVFTMPTGATGSFGLGFAEDGSWGQSSNNGVKLRLAIINGDGSIGVHPGGDANTQVPNHDLSRLIDTGSNVVLGVQQSIGILIETDGKVRIF